MSTKGDFFICAIAGMMSTYCDINLKANEKF